MPRTGLNEDTATKLQKFSLSRLRMRKTSSGVTNCFSYRLWKRFYLKWYTRLFSRRGLPMRVERMT